jgi:hypothetical protein
MKAPQFSIEIEREIHKGKDYHVFFLWLIPSISFRYIKACFGKEANIYLSWLIWTISITLHWRNEK